MVRSSGFSRCVTELQFRRKHREHRHVLRESLHNRTRTSRAMTLMSLLIESGTGYSLLWVRYSLFVFSILRRAITSLPSLYATCTSLLSAGQIPGRYRSSVSTTSSAVESGTAGSSTTGGAAASSSLCASSSRSKGAISSGASPSVM